MEAGQAAWNEYKEVVRISRNETRKAKAYVEFNLAEDIKDNKESFLKHKGKERIMWAHD